MANLPNLPVSRTSLFDEFFRDMAPGFFVRPLHGDPLPQQIKVDVKEDAENFVVHAELPGRGQGGHPRDHRRPGGGAERRGQAAR
jgi:HSP20 family protein